LSSSLLNVDQQGKHVIGINRWSIIVNKHVVRHLWDLPYILSIINRVPGIFLVKLQFSDSHFPLYMEPIYSVLGWNHRICMLFSRSLNSQPHWILWKGCCSKWTIGKITWTGNWSIGFTLVQCIVLFSNSEVCHVTK